MTLAWVGGDWGSRYLRLWLLDEAGALIRRIDAPAPAGDPERALLALVGSDLAAGGRVDVVLAGAPAGWTAPPLVPVPCPPLHPDRAVRIATADPRLRVVLLPGLRQDRPLDLMRGPETTVAGFLAHHPGFDGVLCMTGPQTVWAHVSAGEVVSFRSFMTQDLLDLLANHPLLHDCISASGWDEGAFAAAVDEAMSRPATLAADLLSLRAESALAGLTPDAARARLAGRLIGTELAAARPWWLGQSVVVLGETDIGRAYCTALQAQGVDARSAGSDGAALAGLRAARAALGG